MVQLWRPVARAVARAVARSPSLARLNFHPFSIAVRFEKSVKTKCVKTKWGPTWGTSESNGRT